MVLQPLPFGAHPLSWSAHLRQRKQDTQLPQLVVDQLKVRQGGLQGGRHAKCPVAGWALAREV